MNFIDVTNIFKYWITADWYIALLMSFIINSTIYALTASSFSFITEKLSSANLVGAYIDTRKLKDAQIKKEIFYGVFACFIFSITSLLIRSLSNNIWPETALNFAVQLIVFPLFYESYSYFVHRLLHIRLFRKIHSIHHSSVRVTPWSAYSVHPIEALFIGVSAPLFMFLFPMSLSVVLTLHIFGMVFTILLHSNFAINESLVLSSKINNYTNGHVLHHQKSLVNFGFVNSFWDKVFKTNSVSSLIKGLE